ncbi:MAG: hypothetical protein J6N52_06105 [Clostridia bacterium]|nr:hypothetical protein [Clostridia bacterium]
MNKKNLAALVLTAAVAFSSTAFAMPSYQTAPDAATWGTAEDTFTALDYLQTSLLKGRQVGLRGNVDAGEHLGGGIYSSLTLPKVDTEGRAITWTSSDPNVLGTDGTYVKPATTKTVTLTATAGENGEFQKKFEFRAYADYILLDRTPAVGEMIVDENFADGTFDSDIFEAITYAGDTAAVKDGAYSIEFNSAANGGFRIYHSKDHKPLTSGIYVEEFTFDRDTGDNLGNFLLITPYGQVNHIKNGVSSALIGNVSIPRGENYIRVNTPLGGGNIYNGTQMQINWGANGNKDGHRIKDSGSIHMKVVYDIDNGKYKIYIDGTLLSIGDIDLARLETGDVDENDQKVYGPSNIIYTEIKQAGSTAGVTDHLAISDYKFYKAADRMTVQYSVADPAYVARYSNINTVSVLYDGVNSKFTLPDGRVLEPGTPLKVYVCAYNKGCRGFMGIAEYDITVPNGNTGYWAFNPYNDEAFRAVYKGDVKTIIVYNDNGNLIPVSNGEMVRY